MADRTVSLRITAEISDLQGKLRKAQNDMRSFAGEAHRGIQKNRGDWAGLSTSIGLAGGAMVGFAALAVKGYADFDKSMSKVKASGADAAANISALRDAAVKAGADTQYSAGEAADAITDLAKAGVSAKDILGGGLSGALSLAAAGEMDVKEAAETTAVALNQFRLAGSQSSHVADLLAAGAGKAMGEVSDLGMALRQSGLVANQTGLSIEETTGALSAFASAGLLGSDAGTSLKTMLQRLTPQSAEAQAQFDKLGVSAYDTNGHFVGLADFAGQLTDKMGRLTPQARNAAMSLMFGADAVRAANVLYAEGADGIQGWIDAVNDQGFAARQAAILTDNLAGDLERLGGSIDTVFIQSGSAANQSLRGLAQAANAAVDAFGQLPAPILNAGALLTGSGGIGLVGAAGVMKLVGAVSDARAMLGRLGKTAGVAKVAIGGVGAALTVGTLALSAWASSQADVNSIAADFASTLVVVDGRVVRTDASLQSINDKLTQGTVGWFGLGGTITEAADRIGVSMDDLIGYLNGNEAAVQRVLAAQSDYFNVMTAGTGAIDPYRDQLWNVSGALDHMKEGLSKGESAALAKAKADEAAGVGASSYADAQSKANVTTEDGSSALKEYAVDAFKAANAVLALSGSQIGWEAALDDTAKAIEKTGKAHRLANGQLDLNTEKGRANQTALNQLATASVTYAQKLMERGASEEEIQGVLERSRASFIKQAEAAGMSGDAATQLADKLGLVPEITEAKIDTKLNKAGINAWNKWNPPDKEPKINPKLTQDTFTIHFNMKRQGGPKLAGGGAVWGPGTETSDSIDAKLSVGEHVLTAAEVRAFGGHDAVYRMRAQARAGRFPAVRKFATGGAVEPSWSGQPLSYWEGQLRTPLELTQLQIQIRDLEHDLAEKETYYTGKGKKRKKRKRDKLRGLDRTEAQQELAEAKADLALARQAATLNASSAGTIEQQIAAAEAAQDAAEAASEAAQAAAERASTRAGLASDLATSIRRGEIGSSVTSGNGLSVVDQLRSWSSNEALSASARSALARTADTAESRLSSLYGALGTANSRVSELQSVYDTVTSSLNKFDLGTTLETTYTQHSDASGNTWYTENQATGASIAAKAKARAAAIRAFAGKLSKLQKAGLSAVVLQEVASLGTEEGSQVADALLADKGSIADINAAYAEMATWSGKAGQYITEASYKGGLSAAQGVVDGLNSQLTAVGESLASALVKALADSGTSIPGRASGGPVAAGRMYRVNEVGVETFVPSVNGFILTSGQTQQGTAAGPTTAYLTDAQMAQLAQAVVVAASKITTAVAADQAASIRYATTGV